MKPVVIVGRGPSGLVTASMILRKCPTCPVVVVAESAGSLGMWSGSWDFLNYHAGRPVEDPWRIWSQRNHVFQDVSVSQWHNLWQQLSAVWREVGIAHHPIPSTNYWTLSLTGRPLPTFFAPEWQYVTSQLEPIVLVGMEGLADSIADMQSQQYQWAAGFHAEVLSLPAPAQWNPTWTPVRWGAFLDQPVGLQWLVDEIGKQIVHASSGLPLIFPQVLGISHVESIRQTLTRATGHSVYEMTAMPPALGGIRIQERWSRWLIKQGVIFRHGRVKQATGRWVKFAGGQTLEASAVIVAGGGILGGGETKRVDGTVYDTILNQELSGRDPVSVGVQVVGRQYGLCDPDVHGDGGAMNLVTALRAIQSIPEWVHESGV